MKQTTHPTKHISNYVIERYVLNELFERSIKCMGPEGHEVRDNTLTAHSGSYEKTGAWSFKTESELRTQLKELYPRNYTVYLYADLNSAVKALQCKSLLLVKVPGSEAIGHNFILKERRVINNKKKRGRTNNRYRCDCSLCTGTPESNYSARKKERMQKQLGCYDYDAR